MFKKFINWMKGGDTPPRDYKRIPKTCVIVASQILRNHFQIMEDIKHQYKFRDQYEPALGDTIKSCLSQIKIAEEVAKEMKRFYPGDSLPTHTGFHQLAIIFEKQKRYQEALELCKKAKKQGWNGDWDKRISRLNKKII